MVKKVVTEEVVAESIQEAKRFDPETYLGRTVLVRAGMHSLRTQAYELSGMLFAGIITAISGDSEVQIATVNLQLPFENLPTLVWEGIRNRQTGDESIPPPYWYFPPES